MEGWWLRREVINRLKCSSAIAIFAIQLFVALAARAELPLEGRMPVAPSKKGLQVELVDDAIALGVKHATFNVNLSQLFAPDRPADSQDPFAWHANGKTFAFNEGYVQYFDQQIKQLTDSGALVYLILLAYESGDPRINALTLHPGYDHAAPNRLAAFNTATQDGRAWFDAALRFMARRWSLPDARYGRVVGYIIGNEVNSHWWWSNMGRVTMEEFAADYLQTVRVAHDAIRSQATWPRVYLSLEHHWNIRYAAGDERQSFPARAFLDHFDNLAKASDDGNFEWHVAFHPYPENLFEPRFWNDKTARSDTETPRITFKNLDVLMSYLDQPALQFQGESRRVILSEQGFHTRDDPDGELIQAAAYCYAYRLVDSLPGIDAFILHRHVDHPHEGGLKLGLRRYVPGEAEPRPKKRIYDCFRVADTADWEETFEFALPIVGIDRWPTNVRPQGTGIILQRTDHNAAPVQRATP